MIKAMLRRLMPDALWNATWGRIHDLDARVRMLESMVDALALQPRYAPGDDIGFNGQRGRKLIFNDIVNAVDFNRVIETGTYMGNTTGYMAQTTGLPIHSCEADPRANFVAQCRLADFGNVQLTVSDSRAFLRDTLQGDIVKERLLFYLDAHWHDDLPLPEELELIATRCDRFAIIVDDFHVPGDDGYNFDDYGPGKSLTPDLIQPEAQKYRLGVFYPAMPSRQETGRRRGCVVITSPGEVTDALSQLDSLRA